MSTDLDRRAMVDTARRAAERAYLAPSPADALAELCLIVDVLESLGLEVPTVDRPRRCMAGSLAAEASLLGDGRSISAWRAVAVPLAHVLAEASCDCADLAA